MKRTRTAVKLLIGAFVIATFSFGVGGGKTTAHAAPQLPFAYPSGTPTVGTPNNLDCNGWSPAFPPVKVNMKMLCTDPVTVYKSPTGGITTSKFYDNGHYVGHDEPVTKFISTAVNSANTFTFFQQLSRDPKGAPTTDPNLAASASKSQYALLSVAPWFGLPICDPLSFPHDPATMGSGACTPDSDSNNPNTAGSAFMELQFYPPGYGPFPDSTSCDQTRWCSALNIDSLTCAPGCASQNPNCVEPINFAYLTDNGVPVGPANPQNANTTTLTPSIHTLFMNDGDTLKVSIFEVPDNGTGAANTGGLETRIDDITTGQSGFMIASAANTFMNTNPTDCSGNPFSFHAEYNTAKQSNIVPWAALEGGVLMQDEIGHGEVCGGTGSTKLANQDSVGVAPPSATFQDVQVFDSCNDATSDPQPAGQTPAPTNPGGECQTGTMSACTFGTTEDAVGTNTFGGRHLTGGCVPMVDQCEVGDGFCLPQGSRTVTINSVATTWTDAVAYCDTARFQNGDLDFDGTPYQTLWPDGKAGHPQTFRYIGPFDQSGNNYPTVQLETDAGGSEQDCNTTSGAGCTIPPYGAKFYPFWSISNVGLDNVSVGGAPYCVWNFGGDGNPGELNNFGGITAPQNGSTLSQYGSPGSHFKGTLITGPFANPQINNGQQYSCPQFVLSQVTTTPGNSIPELPWVPAVVIGGLGVAGIAGYRRQRKAS